MKYFLFCILLLPSYFIHAQTSDCRRFHDGNFRIVDTLSNHISIIERKGKNQVEYKEGSDLKILVKIKWVDDCTYIATIYKLQSGGKKAATPKVDMRVEITETRANSYIFKASIKGLPPFVNEMVLIK